MCTIFLRHGLLGAVLLVLGLSFSMFSAVSAAGDYEIGAAKGLMIASILHEKCTGQLPLQNETERQINMLLSQGFLIEDIQRGFMEGMLYAEGTYPRNKRPSKSECKSASRLYWQSIKAMR